MKREAFLGLILLSSCGSPRAPEDLSGDADRMVEQANAWQAGDSLPGALLEYRGPEMEGFCIGLGTDTRPVFARVTNYPLLLELVSRPGVHDRVYEHALERALVLRGPLRVFGDVEDRLARRPLLFQWERYRELSRRAEDPHAWVRAVLVRDGTRAGDDPDELLGQLVGGLRKGLPWPELLGGLRGSSAFRNRIGDLGDWVVSPGKPDALPFRLGSLSPGDLYRLLSAQAGDVLVLPDKEQSGSVLFLVREIYPPLYPDKSRLLEIAGADGQCRPARTLDDWARRRRHILASLKLVMGPLPGASARVPLDLKVEEERPVGSYDEKRISFAAEAGDRVTALLLVPRGGEDARPAMLCLHPTSPLGKEEITGRGKPNREYASELAERGFVVLAPDYPNFGGYTVDPYRQGYLSATMKGIWNHRRAVDLLVSLPQVDPGRIGVIGHSLGGHNSLFAAAFDPRLRVVVTSCGFTSFAKYYGGNLEGWSHKGYMPRIREVYAMDPRRMPFDFPEILGLLAPRPVFVNAPLRDSNFEVSGVQDCVEAAQEVYRLYQDHPSPGLLRAVYPDAAHDFPPSVREEAYAFIQAALE